MRIERWSLCLLLACSFAGAPACRRGGSAQGTCTHRADASIVACVDGVALGPQQVSTFAEEPWWIPGSATLPDGRRQAAERAIRTALFAAEAKKRGLSLAPGVPDAMASWALALRDDEVKKRGLTRAIISDDEARKHYEDHKERFNQIDRVDTRILVVASAKAGEELYPTAAKADADAFAALVAKSSIDEKTKADGGKRMVVAATDEDHELLKMALTLRKAGAVGGPFKMSDGRWCIVRIDDAPLEHVKKLDENMMLTVKNAMLDERIRAAMDEVEKGLRATAKIEIFDDALPKVELPKPK